MAGIDTETLNQIANFGGKYVDYLWWKDVIMPTVHGVLIFMFIGVAILWIAKIVSSDS
jgi:hypothetical protein